ncbi:HipA family kinase [Allostreptomyces psammosilenae]|uniref:HipA-like kinase domain-containing protein n=1 Tax=Allostreptomyces psammosilenae TaxID=1892865 RepID=A0A852ZPD9_9ACTN|nr:HipA family kinase [Allostreptomyces psammosilenae]NYI04316.1 hypothetical protein [Allostreptomyces psammosilenae]
MLPLVTATRYVVPLREGGSLPGLIEADDLGTYVVKFTGAGQGRKTLVAEILAARLARGLGLPVPDLALVEVDPVIGLGEPDQEVQELLRASPGLNLGMDFLPGSLGFDPLAFEVDPDLASRVLWFDAFIGNVDRSWRNPNMLLWHGRLHLIDHGAAFIWHHNWPTAQAAVTRPYNAADHALLRFGPEPAAVDAEMAAAVTDALLADATAEIPDVWLAGEDGFSTPDEVRRAYRERLADRLAARERWLPRPDGATRLPKPDRT